VSRFTVSHDGLTFAYGFDRPLSEYFLSVSGPARQLAKFACTNGIRLASISCDYSDDGQPNLDTDDEVYLHLVGTMSDKYGGHANFLEAVWKFNLAEIVDRDHMIRAGMDLPF